MSLTDDIFDLTNFLEKQGDANMFNMFQDVLDRLAEAEWAEDQYWRLIDALKTLKNQIPDPD